MGKFKAGDRCKVVKNAISPKSIGHIVKIVGTIGNMGYRVRFDNGMVGMASENCLGLADEE